LNSSLVTHIFISFVDVSYETEVLKTKDEK
jgi:hypothetical protein